MKKEDIFKDEWNAVNYSNYINQNIGHYIDEDLLEKMVSQDDFLHINWTNLTEKIPLTENFLRAHKYDCRFYWPNICSTNNLSEDFMREFANKMCWSALMALNKLSDKFIWEMKDYIFESTFHAIKFLSEPRETRVIQNNVVWCIERGIKLM